MIISILWAAVVLYTLTTVWHCGALLGRWRDCRWGRLSLGAVAVAGHAVVLYAWIDLGHVQNLTWLNVVSMTLWLAALLILAVMPFRRIGSLNILIYPLAALSLPIAALFAGHHLIDSAGNSRQLIHILLAILSFSVSCLAAMQAFCLSLYNRVLRSRYAVAVRGLPAVVVMERILVQLITCAFILLTTLLLTTLWWFELTPAFRLKWIMASLAWLLFGTVLLGRIMWHWRGRILTEGTLLGVLLLVLAYFGTRMFSL